MQALLGQQGGRAPLRLVDEVEVLAVLERVPAAVSTWPKKFFRPLQVCLKAWPLGSSPWPALLWYLEMAEMYWGSEVTLQVRQKSMAALQRVDSESGSAPSTPMEAQKLKNLRWLAP